MEFCLSVVYNRIMKFVVVALYSCIFLGVSNRIVRHQNAIHYSRIRNICSDKFLMQNDRKKKGGEKQYMIHQEL